MSRKFLEKLTVFFIKAAEGVSMSDFKSIILGISMNFLNLFEDDTLGRAYRGAINSKTPKQTYLAMKTAQAKAQSMGEVTVTHMILPERLIAKTGTDSRGNLRVTMEKALDRILSGKAGEISVSVESIPWKIHHTVLLIGNTKDLLEYYDYDAITSPHGKIPKILDTSNASNISWDEGIVDSAKVKWHTVYVDKSTEDMWSEDPETWMEEHYPRIAFYDYVDGIRNYISRTSRQQEEEGKNMIISDWNYEMHPIFMTSRYRGSYIPDIPQELVPFQKVFGELSAQLDEDFENGISPAYAFDKWKAFRDKLAPVLAKIGYDPLCASEHEWEGM